MNDWKFAITLATCCICITMVPSASADFVGVTTVNADDPDTEFLCAQGNGVNVPGPLTVCNVYAVFDHPDNVLLSVGNVDLQVFDGEDPDVFFQHPFGFTPVSPACAFIEAFPDLICDSFVTFGVECGPSPPAIDYTTTDMDFDASEFASTGHIVGGWFNSHPVGDQGVAGEYPDLQMLVLRSSVAQGLRLSGTIDLFWWISHDDNHEVYAELDVPIECGAACGSCATDTDGDGDTDAMDLAVLLGNWGPVDAGYCLDADGDALIGAFDLAGLLGAWGPCL